MTKKYKLLRDRFEHKAGITVYAAHLHDYGIARDDSFATGVEHISVTATKDEYPLFTVPVSYLEEIKAQSMIDKQNDPHAELRAQYKAEAAINPEAWKNWQCKSDDLVWVNFKGRKPGSWNDVPRFLSLTEYRRNPDAPPFPPPIAQNRHEHADLIIAAANGEQMQQLKNIIIVDDESIWRDCTCDIYMHSSTKEPVLSTFLPCGELAKSRFFGGWLGEAFTVEVPVYD